MVQSAKRDSKQKGDEDVEGTVDQVEDHDEAEHDEDSSRGSGSHEAPIFAVEGASVGRSFKNVYTIAVRELRSYFDSLVAYVVLGGSMLALGLYFFNDTPLSASFWKMGRADMTHMFEFLPAWMSVIVIPLVTMRAVAEEKRSGTLELLITMPVRDAEVILGKYLAAVGMVTIMLAATALYPLCMFKFGWHLGSLDWGPVWAGYFGLFLFSLAAIALGLMLSCITESQIIAFFVTAFTLTVLYAIGSFVETLHGWAGDTIAFISLQSRFAGFERGLIDTNAVIYFLSVSLLCLLIAFRSLESRKWS
jgi:ABC-2 type transport system permease protein